MVQTRLIYSIYVRVCIYVRVYTHIGLRKGTTLQNVSSLISWWCYHESLTFIVLCRSPMNTYDFCNSLQNFNRC